MAIPAEVLKASIAQAGGVIASISQLEEQILRAADLITNCLLEGRKILVCGNGGSAADAADFATEFACKFMADRKPYPALNLSQGGSLLSAIGNDYGFEEIFARQVVGFGRKGDVIVAISTSGNSANIRRALLAGRDHGLNTIALLGRTGGVAAGLAEIELIVCSNSTARIQEAHKFILHVICEICEEQLSSR